MSTIAGRKLFWSAAWLAGALTGYLFYIRPRHLRWGASRKETTEHLPGDELIPDADSSVTHAITILAPPKDVWVWIAQLGQDKGGFYSYTMLENVVGCEMRNADEVHPEWQGLHEGDVIKFHPDFPAQPISILKEGKHMVIGANLGTDDPSTWAFIVRDLGHGVSRLVVRLRYRKHTGVGRATDLLFLEPAHFVMERKMMLTIKKLAEQRAEQAA